MNRPQIIVCKLDLPLPLSSIRGPFAVLVDIRDPEWADSLWVNQKAVELLEAGCRYFVCFGPGSEAVHDRIDDVIVNCGYDVGVLTTFHDDESIDDVVNFFDTVATRGMAQGVVLAHNVDSWRAMF